MHAVTGPRDLRAQPDRLVFQFADAPGRVLQARHDPEHRFPFLFGAWRQQQQTPYDLAGHGQHRHRQRKHLGVAPADGGGITLLADRGQCAPKTFPVLSQPRLSDLGRLGQIERANLMRRQVRQDGLRPRALKQRQH